MLKKGVIIGTFVNKNKILSFLEKLKNDFSIKIDKIYVYSIESNNKEYLVTFKTYDKDKAIKELASSKVMHVKNGCIFSINALNKLIEQEYTVGDEKPYNEIEIDWDEYENKLIVLTNGNLNIVNLSKIEDKCTFFV